MTVQLSKATENHLSDALAMISQPGADGYAFSRDMFDKGEIVSDAPLGAKDYGKFSKGRKDNGGVSLKNDTAADFGAKATIDTLTSISQEIIKQKRYMPEIGQFMPVKAGNQPYRDSLITYKQFGLSSNPEKGLINPNNTGRFEESDVAYDTVTVKRYFWAMQVSWNFILQRQIAANAYPIDLIGDKLENMAKDHKQFQQGVAMYGLQSFSGFNGLFNASGVTTNTSLIAKPLNTMTAAELNAFAQTIIATYQSNNAIFEMPDTFVIPQYDYTGLASFVSDSFPMAGNTKLAFLESVFKTITGNQAFKIIPTPYAQQTGNGGWNGHFGYNPLSYDRYVLYQNDKDTLELDLPIPFTMLGTGTANQANFVNIGFSQTGQVFVKRTQNILYLDNLNS